MADGAARAVKVARRRFALGCALYTAALTAALSHTWPLIPFPEPAALGAVAGISFVFGFAMRRRALLLPALIVPVGWVLADIGPMGGAVAFTGAAPLAVAAASGGSLSRGGLVRLRARRAVRRAERQGRARRLVPRFRRRPVPAH